MISILIPSALEDNIVPMLEATEKEFPKAQIIIATDRDRRGKGWAMRQALSQATGEIICFIDGDGDIHPDQLYKLIPRLREYDIVVGKKDPQGIFSRMVLTIISRWYIWLMFRIPVDTQTGIKCFHRYALPDWDSDGFEYDIEILAKAKKDGMRMFDIGIEAKTTRRMEFSSIWATLMGSFRI